MTPAKTQKHAKFGEIRRYFSLRLGAIKFLEVGSVKHFKREVASSYKAPWHCDKGFFFFTSVEGSLCRASPRGSLTLRRDSVQPIPQWQQG